MDASILVPRCLLVNCPDLPLETVRAGPQLLVTRPKNGQEASGLLYATVFRLIVAQLPIPDLSTAEFVAAVRNPRGRNKDAALVLIATPGGGEGGGARALKGVNELLIAPVSRDRLASVVERFGDIAERKEARILVRARNEMKPGEKQFLGQAHNLSRTGMLLSLDRPLPIGTPLELQFAVPGQSKAIKCSALIVRGALERRITGHAYGVHFTVLEDADRLTIADFCRN